jgi:hypothetical protein
MFQYVLFFSTNDRGVIPSSNDPGLIRVPVSLKQKVWQGWMNLMVGIFAPVFG